MARREFADLIADAHQRLRGAVLENLPWERCIELYDGPRALFYVDPPYIQVSNPYGTPFTDDNQRRLAAALRAIRGRFILSINDHPLAHELYRGCRIRRVTCPYGSTARTGRVRRARELLITGPPRRSRRNR